MNETLSGKEWSGSGRLLFLTGIVFLFYLSAGSATGRTILVPSEYATIQAAIDAATKGDVISIQPGTYKESVTILGSTKAGISLQGVDAATTIINPGGTGRGISILVADNVSINKLTVTGGYPETTTYTPQTGGGIFVDGSKNITISSCLITNNRASNGGGFAAQNSTVILSGNTINANKALSPTPRTGESRGGGAFLYMTDGIISNNHFVDNMSSAPILAPGGGLFLQKSSPTVSGNTFSNNQAIGSQHYGGGLYIYDSWNFTVSENTFDGNEGLDGGGMAVIESNVTITGNNFIANRARWGAGVYGWHMSSSITSNTFSQNSASDGGGGILFDESPNAVFTGNTVTNNIATNWGGGVDLYKSACTISGNTIKENKASHGAGVAITPDSNATLSNNLIKGNQAQIGGGITIGDNSNPMIKNNLLSNNLATNSGGGIVIYSKSSPQIINNTFYANQAPENWGGAVRIDNSTPILMNNIFDGVPTTEAISAVSSSVQLTYNDFYNNKTPYAGIGSAFNPTTGNITVDPKFISAASSDFNLRSDSPCRNTGNPDAAYNNPDGTRNTMGMYGGPGGSGAMASHPVYRFFNNNAGGHFFTISEDEKNTVINNYKWFRYEGVGFYASPTPTPGAWPVYRFFNNNAGGHFFTISEDEKNTVINNYKWFRYEGVGFYAFPTPTAGAWPVYRFFNNNAGGHFFTISEDEKNTVINNYKWFRYEGAGFYAYPTAN